jgi:ATP-dependent Lhr-like helicase
LLSLDRALLDELMGAEGADESTLAMLETVLARRRGTAPGTRARSADELAALIDRAGDLTLDEVRARIAPIEEGRRGDPLYELTERGRVITIDVPNANGSEARMILTENRERYDAAFGGVATPSITPSAARREILVRYIALAGAVSIEEIRRRYDFDAEWLRERLDEWTRTGKLVRGTFGGDAATIRWCTRRLLEQARRRELAQARKQIEAVDLNQFSRFMLDWQHLEPSARLSGDEGTVETVRQMYGLSRPAEQWEREYFPSRVEGYAPDAIARLMAAGEAVWVGGNAAKPDEVGNLSTVRFVRRGSARAWLSDAAQQPLSENAQRVLASLEKDGASFFDELIASTSMSARALRDALRELVGASLITNDTMDSLRDVVRWRPFISPRDRAQPDPTRWLPADFTPSTNRYVVQRRPNLRRLPKWKRPDRESVSDAGNWPGRWSLVRTPRVWGPEVEEAAWAEMIGRQWLERYGVVSREIWRRERPSVGWRAIYRELKRLEFRGEVRRGYFVRGLSGAQFAVPEAVELLRTSGSKDGEAVVFPATDPANVYSLPLPQDPARDAFVRPRSRGALLVAVNGVVLMMAERRGARVVVRPDTAPEVVTRAAQSLVGHLLARSSRDLIIETIDGVPASGSHWIDAFTAAGFRRGTTGLRYYRSLSS